MQTFQPLKIAATVAALLFAAAAAAQTGAPPASAAATPSHASESLGEHVSDATVTAKAKAELIAAKDVKASRVHVKTRRGVVSLTGTVPSAADKTRTQEIVEGIGGVRSVNNHLKVIESGAGE